MSFRPVSRIPSLFDLRIDITANGPFQVIQSTDTAVTFRTTDQGAIAWAMTRVTNPDHDARVSHSEEHGDWFLSIQAR